MKPTRDEQAFAELLDGLRQDAPGDMARLARLAEALEHVRPQQGPAPHFRNNLRNRLIAEAAVKRSWLDRATERWTERNLKLRRSFRIVFANAVAAAVLLAGGAVFASADKAVPGDWNYFAKKARESARLFVTNAPEARAYLEMDLARERLDEVRELVNRGQTAEKPYFTALDDMDFKTLDATRLLIENYGRTKDAFPLDRLAQFAVAQRNGLEVLVDRLPPGARPPARDSIDILQRVADRVTGIVGGCLCPANPLLPKVSSGSTVPSNDTGGVAQAPSCACSRFRGESSTTTPIGNGPRPSEPTEPEPDPVESPKGPVDSTVDTVEDTVDSVTDTVNDLIDDALEGTVLDPIVPPVPTVSVPDLGL